MYEALLVAIVVLSTWSLLRSRRRRRQRTISAWLRPGATSAVRRG